MRRMGCILAFSPAAEAAQQEKARCRGDRTHPASPPPTLLRGQPRDAEPDWCRPVGLRGKSLAERLPLCGVLREPCLDLGMRRKICRDLLGTLARQLTVDMGVQVVLTDGPAMRHYLILLSSALQRGWPSLASPFT